MFKRLTWLVHGMFVVFRLGVARGYTPMGDVTSYSQQGHTVTFECANGVVRVGFLDVGLVRVHMSPNGIFPADTLHENENGPYAVVTYTWPGVGYQISQEHNADIGAAVYTIEAGRVLVKVQKSP